MRSSNSRLLLPPTVPLTWDRIHARTWRKAVFSAVLPMLAIGGALFGASLQWGVAGTLASTVATTAIGFWAYWNHSATRLEQLVIHEMVRESYIQQDEIICRRIETLNSSGHYEFAKCLREFLDLKQSIEMEMHRDGQWNARKARFESLVDGITGMVCREFTELATLDNGTAQLMASGNRNRLETFHRERSHRMDRVMRAYQLMLLTKRRLALIMTQSKNVDIVAAAGSSHDDFSSYIMHELAEEHVVANRIKDELADDYLSGYAERA